jgi:hypothetical protein
VTFATGVVVEYNDYQGIIKFCCDSYVTICIKEHQERVKDVCILVYSSNWNKIRLLKESQK